MVTLRGDKKLWNVDVVMAIQSNWFSLVDQRLICVEKQDRWWPNGTYSEEQDQGVSNGTQQLS
ncbi:hypothetical protein SCLCIDRAFT_1217565 [Scleroderma citrinum Foug A]|uniref:Uncharacterized protein n=1 Tax=Scleroderma citrinum Foug A TaxID=1036808 RepID=A0A0C3DTX2_9AGAM|nr:hypothetical protein SCLCIDRAFT_1217565 [Scleroderma citrinum Foug A]